jgi:hypothetical protein
VYQAAPLTELQVRPTGLVMVPLQSIAPMLAASPDGGANVGVRVAVGDGPPTQTPFGVQGYPLPVAPLFVQGSWFCVKKDA